MNDLLRQAVSLSLFVKCVAAAVGILIIHAAFRVLEQTLPRRFGRADARYKIRKFVVFSGYLSILLFLAFLFEDRLGRLGFAVGVVSAGVAVALQTCWPALPAPSPSVFQSCTPWETEFRSATLEVT
jgi:hypothetical protein